jgi:hypothetical protein
MNDHDLFNLIDHCAQREDGRGIAPIPVVVLRVDGAHYGGWIIGAGIKRDGKIIAVVEDKHKNTSTHAASEIATRWP